MTPETAIALALLSLFRERGEAVGSREDVAERLKRMRSNDVRLVGIRLRPEPEGLDSAEVSEFVGRMIVTGLVAQESPIRLRPQAVTLIKRHLAETIEGGPDCRAELSKAAEALDMPVDDLLQDELVP